MKKNQGLWWLLGLTIAAVALSVFDFQWEKKQEEKKKEESKLFVANKDSVKRIVIQSPKEGRMVLEKKSDSVSWRLIEPVQDEVDDSQIIDFLGKLAEGSYEKKLTENLDMSFFGFDKTGDVSRLEVTYADGGADKTWVYLRSELKNFQGKSYLKPETESVVYLVGYEWDSLFDRTVFSFRNKRMYRGELVAIQSMKVNVAGKNPRSFILEKKNEHWFTPTFPDWRLDDNKVRELLYVFTNQTVLEYRKEQKPKDTELKLMGLLPAAVTVELGLGEGKTWKAQLGEDKDQQYFVLLESTGQVVRIANTDYRKFKDLEWKKLRDLRAPFDFPVNDLAKLHVRHKEDWLEAQKKDGNWTKLAAANKDLSFDAAKVTQLIDRLGTLTVEEFGRDLAKAPKTLAKVMAQIRLMKENDEELLNLKAGEPMNFDLGGGIKKNLVPVEKAGEIELYWVSEVDWNKLEIPKLFEIVAPPTGASSTQENNKEETPSPPPTPEKK